MCARVILFFFRFQLTRAQKIYKLRTTTTTTTTEKESERYTRWIERERVGDGRSGSKQASNNN